MSRLSVMSKLPSQDPLRTQRVIELAVLAIAAVFVTWAVLGWLAVAASSGPAALAPAEDSLTVTELKTPALIEQDQVAALMQRPLFWEGRRPVDVVVVPQVQPQQQAAARPAKRLEGVDLRGVFGVGDSLGVIVSVDGKLTRIRVGEQLKGWELVEFADGEARFQSAGVTDSLPLALTTPSVSVRAVPPKPKAVARTGDGDSQLDQARQRLQAQQNDNSDNDPDNNPDKEANPQASRLTLGGYNSD